MTRVIELSGDITGASSALAGLLLVFLGATQAGFDGYDKASQRSVLVRYQRKSRLAFAGFVLSLISLNLSLIGKRFEFGWMVDLSLVSLLCGIAVVLAAAAISTWEIR